MEIGVKLPDRCLCIYFSIASFNLRMPKVCGGTTSSLVVEGGWFWSSVIVFVTYSASVILVLLKELVFSTT